jgi:diguanylate cyclase (GGDEF)-like protein
MHRPTTLNPMIDDLEQRLSLCRNLPSLPAVAMQIVELAQQPEAELGQIARVISLDPALATKLLRIANSPLYASKRRVDNLRQALTLLGLNATLSLALGFTLNHTIQQPWGQRFDYRAMWRRSILAATACRCLGEWSGMPRSEDLMLAGLVQDIGILALGQLEPDRYGQLLAGAGDNARLVELERETFGSDHARIGARLAAMWNLPAYLVDAIAESESEHPRGEVALCVALSGPIADIWIHPEPERMRLHAAELCQLHLGMDRMAFAELTAEVSAAIPEISSLFDISLADPQRVDAILDHARELMVIRNLKGLQQASRDRSEAERLHLAALALRDRGRRDELTGLFNRGYFDERVEAEFAAAAANGWPLSLAVIDIDGFAAINQRDGSSIGDELLRNLAQLLAMNLRDSDVLARSGGDEFCVLLPGTPGPAALSLCRRMLDTLARTPLAERDDRILRVTVSIGLASFDGRSRAISAVALRMAAATALEAARDAGGNQVGAGRLADDGADESC